MNADPTIFGAQIPNPAWRYCIVEHRWESKKTPDGWAVYRIGKRGTGVGKPIACGMVSRDLAILVRNHAQRHMP